MYSALFEKYISFPSLIEVKCEHVHQHTREPEYNMYTERETQVCTLLRNHDENLARTRRTTWMRLRKLVPSRRCTVLPLTSTDMASEVVMSPMSCALLFCGSLRSPRVFSSISLLISAYALVPCRTSPSCRLLSFASLRVGRPTFRARMSIESPSEGPTPACQRAKCAYIAAVVRRPTCGVDAFARRTTNNAPRIAFALVLGARKSAFLILAYRKSHGARDVLKQDRVDFNELFLQAEKC